MICVLTGEPAGKYFWKSKGGTMSWSKTLSSKYIGQAPNSQFISLKFSALQSFGLRNGDKVKVGNFVFAYISGRSTTSAGKIVEALQIYGSDSELRREPDLALVSLYKTGAATSPYYMPELLEASKYTVIDFSVRASHFKEVFDNQITF